jgi:hypothetical protein
MARIGLWCSIILLFVMPVVAHSGSPHMVSCTQSSSGDTLTVDGKEAGLGNETQVQVVLMAEAQCINPGDHHPKAANKESVTAAGTFPVQNGMALFLLSTTATFQPSCSPPMSVVFTDVTVCDAAHDACCSF